MADYERVAAELMAFDTRLNQVMTDAFKIKGQARKDSLSDCQAIKERVREAVAILRECIVNKAVFSNVQIATLNDLAYRGVHHKGLQKKLDKRALENKDYYEKLESELQSISQKTNKESLRTQHGALIEKIGQCPLSVMDTLDCMEDADCMCLSLEIIRPEAAIADPTKLIIKDIIPTFMSASSFLDSAGFTLQRDELAHGGFSMKPGAKLAEGVGRESISGVLPLYLFKEHWDIARRCCPKVLGLMCTADVMGFASSQLYTVPFLVLAKLCDLLATPSTATEAR